MSKDYAALKRRVAYVVGHESGILAIDCDGDELCREAIGIGEFAQKVELNSFIWPGGIGFAVNFLKAGVHELYEGIDELTGTVAYKIFPAIPENALRSVYGVDQDGDGVIFSFTGINLFVPLARDVVDQLKVESLDGRSVACRPFPPVNLKTLSL